jgi:hypothetical protein
VECLLLRSPVNHRGLGMPRVCLWKAETAARTISCFRSLILARHVRGLRAAATGLRPPGGPGARGDGDRPRAAAGSKCGGGSATPRASKALRAAPRPRPCLPSWLGSPPRPPCLGSPPRPPCLAGLVNSETFLMLPLKKHWLYCHYYYLIPGLAK